jgi:hypothetical protein
MSTMSARPVNEVAPSDTLDIKELSCVDADEETMSCQDVFYESDQRPQTLIRW